MVGSTWPLSRFDSPSRFPLPTGYSMRLLPEMRGVRFCRAQRWLLPYLREDFFKGLKVIVFLLVLVLALVMTLSVGLIDPYVTSENPSQGINEM